MTDRAELALPFERVRVFLDYWNLQLSATDSLGRKFMPDWKRIPQWMGVDAVRLALDDSGPALRFDGLSAYMSYNPASAADRRFKTWASNFLDRVPSVQVICKERKPRYAPTCQACHKTIDVCPHCGVHIAGSGVPQLQGPKDHTPRVSTKRDESGQDLLGVA